MLRSLRRSFATARSKKVQHQHPLLSLTTREAGGDHEQIARLRSSTQSAFSQLVHQHEAKDASWVKLLETSEPVRAVVADRVLEVCIAQRQPRSLVHVLTRLEPGVQFSASTSKEALRMVRQTGNSTDLRQLLRLLQPSPLEANLKAARSSPPLQLSLEDLNDTVSLCLQRDELNEAVRWYIAIRDVFGLVPSEATFALILPSLANSKSWEALFAVLGEMRLQNVQVSMRTYDIILQEVQKRPTLRWMYAQPVLLRLAQVRAHEGDRDALLLKSARRTMSVLSIMKKYGAVVDTWETFTKELTPEQSRSILNDKQVLQSVGSSVVKARSVGDQEKNLELLMKRILLENDVDSTASSSLEALVESRIRNCSNNASDNDGVLVGLGLSWLLQSKDGRGKVLGLYEQLDFGARANSSSLRADVLQTVTMSLADTNFGLQETAQLLRSALFSDNLSEKRFELSEELVLGIIMALGRTQDADAIAHLLLLCAQRNVNLTELAFTVASQTLLQKRDYRLVVQLLESYLTQLDATLVGKRGKQLATCSNPNVFSPALEALAQLGELDLMLTLLLTEMKERRCFPSRALFVVAISACGNAGRFEEGVRLFDLARKDFAALPKNSSHDEVRALVTAALTCCAKGRLGTKALSLFAWIDDKLPGLYSGKVKEELRVLQLVVEAMDSPESAPMLPSFLGIVKSRGHRSLQVTRQLLVSCLAVAISSASEDLVAALLTHETAGDAELDDLRQEAEKLLKSSARG